jgi:hypothetical protein
MIRKLLLLTLFLTLILGISTTSVASDSIPVSGGTSQASAGFMGASVMGTVLSVGLVADHGSQLASAVGEDSFQLLDAGLLVASELTVASVEVVEDSVFITMEAVIVGTELSVELGQDSLFFTIEVLHSTLLATGHTIENITELVIDGVRATLLTTVILAEEAGAILGYSFSYSSHPEMILCLVLTNAGSSLFGSTIL